MEVSESAELSSGCGGNDDWGLAGLGKSSPYPPIPEPLAPQLKAALGWSSGSLSLEISGMAPFALWVIFVPGSISTVYTVQSSVKLEKYAFLSTKGDRKNSWAGGWGRLKVGPCWSPLHFDGFLPCRDLSPCRDPGSWKVPGLRSSNWVNCLWELDCSLRGALQIWEAS